jgi:DNA (cytosine-5)-methyltransferase 1
MDKRKKRLKTVNAVDLFCGAGGTSTGLINAVNSLGYAIKLTAINHWDVAIATHSKNHEDVTHHCQSIETLNPTDIVPGKRLQLLVASPECTHHSRARGGKPRSDQKRADAWLLMRWIEKLYVENILIENVKEFVEWGPLTASGKPDKRHKGMYFEQFIAALRVNYNVEHRVLNCADYGDPTTRQRFFLSARRPKHKPIVWPERTHASRKEIAKAADGSLDLHDVASLKPWVAAREIIDWSLEGKSIFGRKKPLSENTMRRIYAGLQKYSLKPFIVPQNSTPDTRDVERPAPTITTTSRGVGLCEAFVLSQASGGAARQVDEPVPTIPGKGAHSVIETEAFQLNLKGTSRRDRDIDDPTFTQAAGGNHQGVVESFLFNMAHSTEGHERRCKSLDDPVPTIAGRATLGLIETEPFLVPAFGERDGQQPRTHSVGDPLPTITGQGRQQLCEPYIVNMKGQSNARSIDDPTFTQTNKAHQYLAEPFIVRFHGQMGDRSIEEPLGTVTAKDRFGLCIPEYGVVLDIRFRMLQPHELAAAMSFPPDYEFTGNREAKVKQIGNAVPLETAKALCKSLLT